MHWRGKWQPTPVFLPGESQGRRGLVGCHLWGRPPELLGGSSPWKTLDPGLGPCPLSELGWVSGSSSCGEPGNQRKTIHGDFLEPQRDLGREAWDIESSPMMMKKKKKKPSCAFTHRVAFEEGSGQSLGQKRSLKKEMATHSTILAWEIPCTEEPWQAIVHGVTKETNMTL